jgi:hypothetical protein
MQQTQPLSKGPQSAIRPSPVTTVTTAVQAPGGSSGAPDTLTTVLGVLALLGTIGALVFAFLVFSAAKLPDWVQ